MTEKLVSNSKFTVQPSYLFFTYYQMSTSTTNVSERSIASNPKKRSGQSNKALSSKKQKIMLSSEIDINAIEFVTRKHSDGQNRVYMNHRSEAMEVQTPWMLSYRGIEDSSARFNDQKPKYQFQCTLTDFNNSDSETSEFINMLQRIESRLIDAAILNSKDWFMKEVLSREVVDQAMLVPSIRYPMDKETGERDSTRPPDFRMKTPCYDGEWRCDGYTEDGNQIDGDLAEHVQGRMQVKAIIRCSQVWLKNNKLGCTWTVKQFMYRQLSRAQLHPTKYAFDQISTSFDVNTIKINEMKMIKEDRGFKRAYVNAEDGGFLYIKTPWLTSPGGIRLPREEYCTPGRSNYELSFVLDGFREEDSEVAHFFENLQQLDQRIVNEACQNSTEWLGRKFSKAVIEEVKFSPAVRVRTKDDGQEDAWFKVEAPNYDGQWKCSAFPKVDDATNRICHTEDLDTHVCGRVEARAILQCKGIWCSGGRFGCNWKLIQLEYQSTGSNIQRSGFAFRSTSPVPTSNTNVDDEDYVQDSEEE